jgi:hypothetical protein
MKGRIILSCIFILVPSLVIAQTGIFLREDFNDLTNWRHLYFPSIERHTLYSIATEASESYLRAESHASASGLVLEKEFNVYEYPKMRWRWKVKNVYHKGDAFTKAGDDYPMRLCIIFKYDSNKAAPMEFFEHSIARLLSGEYPPHSSLEYVWASKEHPENIITSPYTDRVKMILVEKGTMNIDRWLEEKVNVLEDYERAFNQKPPEIAKLAIMNDSDNTGESSVSSIDWIEISN